MAWYRDIYYCLIDLNIVENDCCEVYLSLMVLIFMDDRSERVCSRIEADQAHSNDILTLGQELFYSKVALDQGCNNHPTTTQQFLQHLNCKIDIGLTSQKYLSNQPVITSAYSKIMWGRVGEIVVVEGYKFIEKGVPFCTFVFE